MNNKKRLISIIKHNDLSGLLEVSFETQKGKIFKIPRNIAYNYSNNELSCFVIYFLICENNNFSKCIYIGKSENIVETLRKHILDHNEKREYFFWDYAFVLVGDNLDKLSMLYLEKYFYSFFERMNNYKILSNLTLNNFELNSNLKIVCDDYIDIFSDILEVLGLFTKLNYSNDYQLKLNKNTNVIESEEIGLRNRIIKDANEWYKYCYSKKSMIEKNNEFNESIIYKILKFKFVDSWTHKRICKELSLVDDKGFVVNIIVNFLYVNKENHNKFFKKSNKFHIKDFDIFFQRNLDLIKNKLIPYMNQFILND